MGYEGYHPVNQVGRNFLPFFLLGSLYSLFGGWVGESQPVLWVALAQRRTSALTESVGGLSGASER